MRYTGGKAKIGKTIAKELKKHVGNHKSYIEPFCGSLGVFRHMLDEGLDYYAYDICEDLILLFQSIKEGTFEYFEVTKELYDSLKVSSPSAERAFAGFGSSYGGAFFNGFDPIRKDNGKRNDLIAWQSLQRIKSISDVKFQSVDYARLEPTNALIYCDPPYKSTNSMLNKCEFDSDEFWTKVRHWKSMGNTVIVSEYSAPIDFECIFELRRYSSLKKCFVTEKLFKA